MGKIIDRRCFVSLERDVEYQHKYLVLNDVDHRIGTIYADNDDEACEMFRNGDWIKWKYA